MRPPVPRAAHRGQIDIFLARQPPHQAASCESLGRSAARFRGRGARGLLPASTALLLAAPLAAAEAVCSLDGRREAAEAAPAASITATTVLTGTVCPSAILISRSTPAAGAGISASTLSVEISNSGSSRSTLSPGFLSHW